MKMVFYIILPPAIINKGLLFPKFPGKIEKYPRCLYYMTSVPRANKKISINCREGRGDHAPTLTISIAIM